MTTSDAHDLHDVLLEYWDEVYPHEEYASTHVGLRKKVLDFAGKEGGLKILDLCCATGRALSLFSAVRDATLVGVDVRQEMLRKAAHHLPGARFVNCDALTLSHEVLELVPFDCVLITGGSIHIFNADERRALFGTVGSLLSKNGLFVMDVFQYDGSGEGDYARVRGYFRKDRLTVIVVYRTLHAAPDLASTRFAYIIEQEDGGEARLKAGKARFFDVGFECAKRELSGFFEEVSALEVESSRTAFLVATGSRRIANLPMT